MQRYVHLLRNNPNYLSLWLAQAISLLGDWFNTIVLSALVVRNSDSPFAITLYLLARFLPPLIVSPIAGVLLDRYDRRTLLIISDVARFFTVIGYLFALTPDRLWLLYVLIVIQFSFSALFEPGRNAFLPTLVRSEDLITANMLGSITWSVMLAVGGALGGIVTSLIGIEFALVVIAATFAISTWFLTRIRVSADAQPHAKADVETLTKQDFKSGLVWVKQNPQTSFVLLIKMWGSLGNIDTFMTIFATTIFVVGVDGTGSMGLMWTAFGIGSILVPVIFERQNDGTVKRMRRLVLFGFMFLAVGWFVFGWSPSLLWACVGLLIRAIGGGLYWIYSSVIIQKTIPKELQGRMFSLDMAGFQLATVVSILLTGWAIEALGPEFVRHVAIATGFISLIPIFLWIVILRNIERREQNNAVILAASESLSM